MRAHFNIHVHTDHFRHMHLHTQLPQLPIAVPHLEENVFINFQLYLFFHYNFHIHPLHILSKNPANSSTVSS